MFLKIKSFLSNFNNNIKNIIFFFKEKLYFNKYLYLYLFTLFLFPVIFIIFLNWFSFYRFLLNYTQYIYLFYNFFLKINSLLITSFLNLFFDNFNNILIKNNSILSYNYYLFLEKFNKFSVNFNKNVANHHSIFNYFFFCFRSTIQISIDMILSLKNLNFFNFNFFNFFNNFPIFFYTSFLFLFSTVFSLFLMSYLGLYGVFFVNLITLFFLWLSTLLYFNYFFLDNNFFKIVVGKWFSLYGYYNVNFEFYIDSISYSFMLLTITIAMFVYIYVYSYFRYDSNLERLILFINCFVISMVLLVSSGNLIVFFLGWELIGLTSFLLINFWSSRISTLKSAFKAYTFNKFSDVSLLISIILIILTTNDINILTFNNQIGFYKNFYITLFNLDISIIEFISFFLISSAFVKSAQFGTHTWLPDSMEAPVPASALIHSATLVSAGVFLLLRFSSLFELSVYAFYIIPLIGSFTAFFGGICACYQSDIKRILAYSTISHCGFLITSFSLLIPEYTILYLYVHGFFKASVFLCAGNIIRFSRNYQDFKKMGFFFKYIPFEFFSSFICLINLCGLPFTMGFYIKHILLLGLFFNNFLYYFICVNIIGGALSGLFYSYKFFYYSFLDVKKSKKIIYNLSSYHKLRSFFYSNSSLSSNLAITFLIFFSYTLTLNLFNLFLNKNSFNSSLDIFSFYYSLNFEFFINNLSFLQNIYYFNWLVLFLIISICLLSWRILYKHYYSINYTVLLLFLINFTVIIF